MKYLMQYQRSVIVSTTDIYQGNLVARSEIVFIKGSLFQHSDEQCVQKDS